MASKFFIQKGGKTYGPVASSDLLKMAQSGKLAPTDLVWKEGSETKLPAKRVKGFLLKSPKDFFFEENVPPTLLSSASTKLRPLKPKTSQTPPGTVPSVKTKPDNSNDGSGGAASITLWAFIGVFVLGIGLFMGWNLGSSHVVHVPKETGITEATPREEEAKRREEEERGWLLPSGQFIKTGATVKEVKAIMRLSQGGEVESMREGRFRHYMYKNEASGYNFVFLNQERLYTDDPITEKVLHIVFSPGMLMLRQTNRPNQQ